MEDWVVEFTCPECGCHDAITGAGVWNLRDRHVFRCPQCTFGVTFKGVPYLWGLSMLLCRVMPNLREWEPDLRFDGFVLDVAGYYVAVRIFCPRCGDAFEIPWDKTGPIAERGGLLQCLQCGPMRRGRTVAKEFFQCWPAILGIQKSLSGTGWRMRVVPESMARRTVELSPPDSGDTAGA